MAIEDAAALGILFSKPYFGGDVAKTLEAYNEVRLPRATKVQAAAAKAAYNINERIGKSEWTLDMGCSRPRFSLLTYCEGFSSNTDIKGYKVEDEAKKLTIEEMNAYVIYLICNLIHYTRNHPRNKTTDL